MDISGLQDVITHIKNIFAPLFHNHVKTDITDFPENLSDFENDTGYITSADVESSINEAVNKYSSSTVYINPTTIPIKTGMQLIYYASCAGTISIKMGDETYTDALSDVYDCRWVLWYQTDEISGSFIQNNQRIYLITNSVIEEAEVSFEPSYETETSKYIVITIT